MNETLALQFTHRSDRSFKSDPIPEDQLESIIEAAWHAPTSMNGQHVSVVVVRDAERRARIAELAGSQPWIAQAPLFITVVVDFNKTNVALEKLGATQHIHESVDGFAAGAVDAGIALGNLMLAARLLGLGVVAIGGLRRNPKEMISLLELPALTYPIVGVAIGQIDTPAQPKPRLPLASFRHDEAYHREAIAPAILTYDKVLPEYWQSIGRKDGLAWSINLAKPYSEGFYRTTKPVAAKQGFVQKL